MADQQIEDLTALTALAADDEFVVNDKSDTADDAGGSPKRILPPAMGLLVPSVISTDGNVTGQVGVNTCWDISGLTASRDFTLPSTATVGARCAVTITNGDDAHEVSLKNASGDTINATDHSSSEWSKLFTTGETIVFVCVVADTAWIVERDGRIPCRACMGITTSVTSNSAATDTKLALDNEVFDIGDIADPTTNNRFNIRRGGQYDVKASLRPANSVDDRSYVVVRIKQNTTLAALYQRSRSGSPSSSTDFETSKMLNCVDGDYIEFWFITQDANDGASNNAATTYMQVIEVL